MSDLTCMPQIDTTSPFWTAYGIIPLSTICHNLFNKYISIKADVDVTCESEKKNTAINKFER